MDINEDLRNAVRTLRSGGVILYPTDTIWGIGCDARNEDAVKRVFDIKRRAEAKSLILLTDSVGKIQKYASDVPDVALDVAELATEPTTVIYSGAKNLASGVIAEDGSVGIRVTQEEFSKRLCEMFVHPVVSTSANVSGEASPKWFGEVSEEIKKAVDYVVEYGRNNKTEHKASRIIKIDGNGGIKIIR